MKRWLLGVFLATAVLAVGWFFRGQIRDTYDAWAKPTLPPPTVYRPVTSTPSVPVVTTTTAKQAAQPKAPPTVPTKKDPFVFTGTLPSSVNLAVPFLSQAPKMNWGMPYQEACEEASLIMVDAFYRGRSAKYQSEEGDKAILDLVAWEKKTLGYYEDTTAEETARIMRDYFKRPRVIVKERPTVDDIKAALANGYPVIVPAYGKQLENPNFRNGGPLYHMLVLKGYLPDGRWITNDPGTRKGADFLYREQNIMDAMHDWNGGDVSRGRKVVIVILP